MQQFISQINLKMLNRLKNEVTNIYIDNVWKYEKSQFLVFSWGGTSFW